MAGQVLGEVLRCMAVLVIARKTGPLPLLVGQEPGIGVGAILAETGERGFGQGGGAFAHADGDGAAVLP